MESPLRAKFCDLILRSLEHPKADETELARAMLTYVTEWRMAAITKGMPELVPEIGKLHEIARAHLLGVIAAELPRLREAVAMFVPGAALVLEATAHGEEVMLVIENKVFRTFSVVSFTASELAHAIASHRRRGDTAEVCRFLGLPDDCGY
jgi:hypothetical protein